MAQHKHLFVMDPVEKLNLKLDSTLRLGQALLERGHECYMTSPHQLSWLKTETGSKILCNSLKLKNIGEDLPEIGKPIQVESTYFNALHMRKDPPFDMDYIACTWMLSEAGKHSKIYNNPESLRGMNEKLGIFEFPEHCDHGLMSSDIDQIISFIEGQADGDAILKPLDLFGGRGVQRLDTKKDSIDKIRKILAEETQGGAAPRLIQPFNSGIFEGEVRAFTCFGEEISWCLKVPANGEYLANTRMGATLEAYTPSKNELDMILEISQKLQSFGVEFVGYDIIGGVVSEINITSPRLLLPPGIDEKPYYRKMAKLIEQDLPN